MMTRAALYHSGGGTVVPHASTQNLVFLRVHVYHEDLYTVNLTQDTTAKSWHPVHDGVLITPPWGRFFFPSSIAGQPRGCQYRTIRLRQALGETFPPPTFFVAPTLFQLLWRYRPWKIGPGGVINPSYRVLQ